LIQVLRQPPALPAGRCDVCGSPIDETHEHLVDLRARALRCACRACHLLFSHEGAGGGRLRAIPRRYVRVSGLATRDDRIDALDLPVGLAFFFRSSLTGRIGAFYPSPAGATESDLPLDAWEVLVTAAPALASMASDVEALLLRRRDGAVDAFIVPIDATYELVGRIRQRWRGIAGGDAVEPEIDRFFTHLADRAQTTEPAT